MGTFSVGVAAATSVVLLVGVPVGGLANTLEAGLVPLALGGDDESDMVGGFGNTVDAAGGVVTPLPLLLRAGGAAKTDPAAAVLVS